MIKQIQNNQEKQKILITDLSGDTVTSPMLLNQSVPGILPFNEQDGMWKFTYSAFQPLNSYFPKPVSKTIFLHFCISCIDRLVQWKEFFLSPNQAVFLPEYIFTDMNGEPYFCVLPYYAENPTSMDFLVRQLLVNTPFDPKEDCSYITTLLMNMNSGESKSLLEWKSLFLSLLETEQRAEAVNGAEKVSEVVETPPMPVTKNKPCPTIFRVSTGEVIPITLPVFRIGKKAEEVDYVVDGNPVISRHHANILQKNGVCYLVDCGSTNRTYLNNQILVEGVEERLYDGALFQLGNEVFRFQSN